MKTNWSSIVRKSKPPINPQLEPPDGWDTSSDGKSRSLAAAIAEAEGLITDSITLTTPFARFRLARAKGGTWQDLTWTIPRDVGDFHEVETHIANPTWRDGIQHPILFRGVELPRGIIMLLGGPAVGKTQVLEYMAPLLDRMTKGLTIATFLEPLEANRMSVSVPDLSYKTLLPYLAQFIVGANGEEEVMILDSMSPFLFMSWKGWGLAKFSLNTGAGFWCTSLHNATVKWNRTIFTTLNPYNPKDEIMEAFEMFVKGRVAGVFVLTGDMQGTYFYRASSGQRLKVNISDMLQNMSGEDDAIGSNPIEPRVIDSSDDQYLR